MTREEFLDDYARRSRILPEELRKWGLEVHPCDCGEACCKGWQLVHRDHVPVLRDLGQIPAEPV